MASFLFLETVERDVASKISPFECGTIRGCVVEQTRGNLVTKTSINPIFFSHAPAERLNACGMSYQRPGVSVAGCGT
jgi:hypothetical protein